MNDFESVPVGTIADLERVKQARDEWKQASRDRRRERDSCAVRLDSCAVRLADARGQLDAALEREQALAAHVDQLKLALELAKNSHGKFLMSDPPQDAWKYHNVDHVIEQALAQTPATSLAHVKDKAQADFIDGLFKNHTEFAHPEAGHIVELLVRLEAGLRQQAKELSDD